MCETNAFLSETASRNGWVMAAGFWLGRPHRLLMLSLSAAALAACSGNGSGDTETSGSTETTSSVSASGEGPTSDGTATSGGTTAGESASTTGEVTETTGEASTTSAHGTTSRGSATSAGASTGSTGAETATQGSTGRSSGSSTTGHGTSGTSVASTTAGKSSVGASGSTSGHGSVTASTTTSAGRGTTTVSTTTAGHGTTSISTTTSGGHGTTTSGHVTTTASSSGTNGGTTGGTTGAKGSSSGAGAPANSYTVQRVTNVLYGPDTQFDVMNYSYPVSPPGPTPAVVLIHGGSWGEGAGYTFYSQPSQDVIDQYAAYGLFTTTIDYRCLPTYPWPAMIADVRLALRYLRENAAALNIDPQKICVMGDSAGGQLAQLAGYDHDGIQPWDVQLYTTQASDAQCVVSMFGPSEGGPGGSNTPDQKGLDYVDAGAVPTWITQGADDHTVSPPQSIDLYLDLAASNIARTYYQYYPGDHEFAGAASSGPDSLAAALADEGAWILGQFGLPNGGLSTTAQMPSCGALTANTPALLGCFVSAP